MVPFSCSWGHLTWSLLRDSLASALPPASLLPTQAGWHWGRGAEGRAGWWGGGAESALLSPITYSGPQHCPGNVWKTVAFGEFSPTKLAVNTQGMSLCGDR